MFVGRLTYLDIALIGGRGHILIHLVAGGSLLVPLCPVLGLGAQRRGHHEVLVLSELFENGILTLSASIFG